jgi:HD domain
MTNVEQREMTNVEQRNADRWSSHPIAARLVRLSIFVVPFLTAMAVAYILSAQLPMATTMPIRAGRWLGIVVASTVAMMVVDRLARRLLPLSALLKLTLVFPDQAPSRFNLAMRTGTTAQLKKRLDAAREVPLGETPQQAAERLLELVGLLSHHDRLTRGHSERVRAYTHLIGEELGLTGNELDKLRWAGLLHDIGKTAISTNILNKPGRLTADEFAVIRTHPDEGRALVGSLADWLGDSIRAVWEHHERFDGAGYPRGLAGLDISFAARVVSVADSYDVMTSARSYKQPMSPAAARAELAACSGAQFDPIAVRAFLNVSLGRLRLMSGPLAWFAQLALFEPSGIVHAGGTVAGSGSSSSGVAASSAATTAAGVGTSAAASGGTAGIVSTVAATAMSVVASTAGIVVAAQPAQTDGRDLAVVEYVDEVVPLDAPADTVVVVAGQFDRAQGDATARGDDSDDASGADEADSSDLAESTASTTVARTSPDQISAVVNPPVTTRGTSGGPSSPPATAASGGAPRPASPPTTVKQPTTTKPPATTNPSPTTTVPARTTTSTTTVATTTTTVPPPAPTPPLAPSAMTLHLGGLVTASGPALPFHVLSPVAPPEIPMPNYDTDRDSRDGALVTPSQDGVLSSDPRSVSVFANYVTSTLDLNHKAEVDLWIADAGSGADTTDIEVGIFRCSSTGECDLIGSDVKRVNHHASSYTKRKFNLGTIQEQLLPGERLEVRVAVLDTSDVNASIGFGTATFDSTLTLKPQL